MSKPNIKKNYIYNVIYQLMLMLVPLITTPYVSRTLSVEGIGIYSYANSIISYFLLIAALGTTTFGQREVAYHQNDIYERSKAFWEVVFLRIVTSIFSLIFYFSYLFIVNENRIVFVVLSLNILNNIADIGWFFQGMEEFSKITKTNIIFKVINVIFIFVFIQEPSDLTLYVFGMCIFTLLNSIFLWIYIPKYIVCVKNIHPLKNIKESIELFLPTVAFQVYAVLDKSMIGWASDTSVDNGCYEQAEKIVLMAKTVLTSMSTVLLPRMANVFKEKKYEEARKYISKTCGFDWLLGMPMMMGLIAVSDYLVPVFLGPGYERAIIILRILSPIIVITSISGVIGYQYLIAAGKQNVYTKIVFVTAGINFIFNVIFIPRYLAVGAAIGSILAECINITVLIIYMISTKMLKIYDIFCSSIKPVFASVIMFALLMLLKTKMIINELSLFVLVLTGILIYIMLMVIFKDQLFIENINIIIQKMKISRKGRK